MTDLALNLVLLHENHFRNGLDRLLNLPSIREMLVCHTVRVRTKCTNYNNLYFLNYMGSDNVSLIIIDGDGLSIGTKFNVYPLFVIKFFFERNIQLRIISASASPRNEVTPTGASGARSRIAGGTRPAASRPRETPRPKRVEKLRRCAVTETRLFGSFSGRSRRN